MINKSKNSFIVSFEEKLKDSFSPTNLIENEIAQIRTYTTTKHAINKSDKRGISATKTNSVFDLSSIGNRNTFNRIFIEYSINGNFKLDDNELQSRFEKPLLEKAKMFVEYYNWLKEIKIPKSDQKFSSLNNDQKLLALHYLFPNITDYTNIQLAKVLGQILNIGSENIRKNLTNILDEKNEIHNEENFYKLIELFEDKTFESITNKLDKKISRMK